MDTAHTIPTTEQLDSLPTVPMGVRHLELSQIPTWARRCPMNVDDRNRFSEARPGCLLLRCKAPSDASVPGQPRGVRPLFGRCFLPGSHVVRDRPRLAPAHGLGGRKRRRVIPCSYNGRHQGRRARAQAICAEARQTRGARRNDPHYASRCGRGGARPAAAFRSKHHARDAGLEQGAGSVRANASVPRITVCRPLRCGVTWTHRR